MENQEYSRDANSDDGKKATFSKGRAESLMEKAVSLMESAPLLDPAGVLVAYQETSSIFSGVICGIMRKDKKGPKYCNLDKETFDGIYQGVAKAERPINLWPLFSKIATARDCVEGYTMRFDDDRFEGTVGKAEFMGTKDNAEVLIRAMERERDKTAAAIAFEGVASLSAVLGSEGLMPPHEKLSVAGMSAACDRDIDKDMEVYEGLALDFAEERELREAQERQETEGMKR